MNDGTVKIRQGSDKNFGLTMATVFFLIALWPSFKSHFVVLELYYWALAISCIFAVFALVKPGLLAPLKRSWFLFGLLLGRIVSPIVVIILFGVVFLPVGVLLKTVRYDPMQRRLDKNVSSYWLDVTQAEKTHLREQF